VISNALSTEREESGKGSEVAFSAVLHFTKRSLGLAECAPDQTVESFGV
jgi:hypothetical protein